MLQINSNPLFRSLLDSDATSAAEQTPISGSDSPEHFTENRQQKYSIHIPQYNKLKFNAYNSMIIHKAPTQSEENLPLPPTTQTMPNRRVFRSCLVNPCSVRANISQHDE